MRMVVEALLALPECEAARRVDQEIVFPTALLHDIAKHGPTVIDPVSGAISTCAAASAKTSSRCWKH